MSQRDPEIIWGEAVEGIRPVTYKGKTYEYLCDDTALAEAAPVGWVSPRLLRAIVNTQLIYAYVLQKVANHPESTALWLLKAVKELGPEEEGSMERTQTIYSAMMDTGIEDILVRIGPEECKSLGGLVFTPVEEEMAA